MNNTYTTVLFDADNTLLDFDKDEDCALRKVMTEYGVLQQALADMYSSDEQDKKAADAITYIKDLPGSEKARLYTMISYYEMGEDGTTGLLGDESSIDDLRDGVLVAVFNIHKRLDRILYLQPAHFTESAACH